MPAFGSLIYRTGQPTLNRSGPAGRPKPRPRTRRQPTFNPHRSAGAPGNAMLMIAQARPYTVAAAGGLLLVQGAFRQWKSVPDFAEHRGPS